MQNSKAIQTYKRLLAKYRELCPKVKAGDKDSLPELQEVYTQLIQIDSALPWHSRPIGNYTVNITVINGLGY